MTQETQLAIRQYQAGDQAAVWALHKMGIQQVAADLGDAAYSDLHQIEQVYLRNRGEFLVGILDGRLVVMGAIKRTTAERAEVKRMRVQREFQGQGLGQQILTRLEVRAVELGYRTLHLDTSSEQLVAQALYRKHGYRQLEETQKVQGLTLLFFEKRLQAVSAGE
jgi:ribosomal protein S18 acetylase RimI-like enzyme